MYNAYTDTDSQHERIAYCRCGRIVKLRNPLKNCGCAYMGETLLTDCCGKEACRKSDAATTLKQAIHTLTYVSQSLAGFKSVEENKDRADVLDMMASDLRKSASDLIDIL